MPIEYESPAPIAAAGSVYQGAADAAIRRRNAELAAEMYARAQGNAGGGQQQGIDPVLQDAMFRRDQTRTVADNQSLDRTSVPNAQVFAADANARQQSEHFRLQAELSEVQLSQQERMRLERMKNAIGAVSADPTLTEAEKANLITQLKTGIDPLQSRLNQETIKAQAQMRQQQATDFQMRASLKKQELDIMNLDVDKRYHFQADPQALMEISSDLSRALGDKRKFIPDALFDKMVREEAVRQGLGHHAYMQPDGKLMIQEKPGSAAAGGKAGGFDHPSGLTPDQYLKALHEVERSVAEDAKAMKEHPTIPGTRVQAHPELATVAERRKAVREIMADRKLPLDFEEYTAMLKRTGGRAGYDPKKAPWAVNEPPPERPDPNAPKTAPVEFRVSDLDTHNEKIQAGDGLTDGEKSLAASLIAESKWLIQKEPDPAVRTKKYPKDAERLDELARRLDPLLKKLKPPPPPDQPAPPPQPGVTRLTAPTFTGLKMQ